MKKILYTSILLSLVFGCLNGFAQKKIFIRLFDENDRKISKGRYASATDSSITLVLNRKELVIPISQIQTIKLKRSFGAGVWKGALIGGGVVGILGAATADPEAAFVGYNAAEGALAGFVSGAVIGGVLGATFDAIQNRPSFDINQDREKWKKVREVLDGYKK